MGDELVTRPEESYRLWCVVLCGLRNLMNEEALAHWEGCRAKNKLWSDKTEVFGEQRVLGPPLSPLFWE